MLCYSARFTASTLLHCLVVSSSLLQQLRCKAALTVVYRTLCHEVRCIADKQAAQMAQGSPAVVDMEQGKAPVVDQKSYSPSVKLAAVLLYIFMSGCLTFFNKAVVSVYKFNYSLTILSCQMAVAIMVLKLLASVRSSTDLVCTSAHCSSSGSNYLSPGRFSRQSASNRTHHSALPPQRHARIWQSQPG